MTVGDEYVYAELYLTFRCPYSCPYCINAYSGISRDRSELGEDQWVQAISAIKWGSMPVTIGGGEPTVHKGFYGIVHRCGEAGVRFDVLTNLTFDVDAFVKNVNPQHLSRSNNKGYKSIRVSYHPTQSNPYELVHNAEYLQENGFSIGIFGLNHPDNMVKNIEMSELCRKHQVYFFIKDYLGPYKGVTMGMYRYPDAIAGGRKPCMCQTSELLVSPTGDVFKCHRDLYANELSVGNIVDGVPGRIFRRCSLLGQCNPCDVKMKTNRFFSDGHSSVQIEPVET
jgi:MoaA/NifB/PqqE/SkfB family radical SAM enzyme